MKNTTMIKALQRLHVLHTDGKINDLDVSSTFHDIMMGDIDKANKFMLKAEEG